jgi:FHA domain
MPSCPAGHESAADDYCDQCGRRIGGAPQTSSAAGGGSASPGLPAGAPGGGQAGGRGGGQAGGRGGGRGGGRANGGGAAGEPAAEPCPQCGTARSGRFCEVCRFDFVAGTPTAPHPVPEPRSAAPGNGHTGAMPPAAAAGPATTNGSTGAGPQASPASPAASSGQTGATPLAPATGETGATPPTPPASAEATEWWAVVTADRDYFDRVVAVGGPEAAAISFPPYCPERRFSLGTARAGEEKQIGRHSVSRGIDPAIDLTGPPSDPGVSRLHAVLIGQADGGWAVLDPGSENGTLVNDQEIAIGVQVPLHDGDRIHLGAWTSITLRSGSASESAQ